MKALVVGAQLVILFFSIIIHEIAHGYTALLKGDPTARDAGRLTFNPLPHVDIFGTIMLPVLLIIMRSPFLIGWAKPVPVNPYFLRNPKKDMIWIGASGPLSNIGLAILLAIPFRLGLAGSVMGQFIAFGIAINLLLAFFNLIPIPPLDGSNIVQGFLSYEAQQKYLSLRRFGFLIVFFLLWIGLFQYVLIPLMSIFFRLLTGMSLFRYL